MLGAHPAIGVLGGMGPQGSVYLLKTMNELAVKYFNASTNDSFPEIVLDSVPVPDFISTNDNKASALDMLRERVQAMNRIDLDCLSIACNTVHVLLPELQAVSRTPLLSMIETVADEIKADDIGHVVVLGTPSTIRFRLYHNALERRSVKVCTPNEGQIDLMEQVIRHVIAGNDGDWDGQVLARIADGFVDQGAEGVILGCTELPIVFPVPYRVPVYSSVRILALALLRRYYGSPGVGMARV